MSQGPAPGSQRLYTIGHSNHALERFLDLLHGHAIEVLVDVRSQLGVSSLRNGE